MIESVAVPAFVVFACAGIFSGFFYDVLFIFKWATKKNVLVVNVLDLLFCLISGFALIYCIFRFEYGNFALFEVVSFMFGIIFEQIIVKNLWTSPIKWVYNKITLRKAKKNFPLK